ncbi:MAG: Abi family protein [Pseudomonadota bacterium]
MNYNKLKNAISEDRIKPYLAMTSNDESQAIILYLQNLDLSRDLYYNLHWLEIILRNSINKALSNSYGANWYEKHRNAFADIEKSKIDKAISQIIIDNKEVNNSNVVANLTFGFWVSIFNGLYENLWRHCLRQAFPNAKTQIRRKDVIIRLHSLLKIRNRIAHYEQIIKYDLANHHKNIIDIINWIEPDFVGYLKKM